MVVPQAVRRVIPPLLNDFIGLQKDTALVGFLGLGRGVQPGADRVAAAPSTTRRIVIAGILFLLITIPMARFVDWLVARDRSAPRWAVRDDAQRPGDAPVLSGSRSARRCASRACTSRFGETRGAARHRPAWSRSTRSSASSARPGRGKSTLLRCINLIEPIDAGRIVVDGEEITARGVDVNRIRRHIGIVFQAFNLFPHMRVHRQHDAGAAQGGEAVEGGRRGARRRSC